MDSLLLGGIVAATLSTCAFLAWLCGPSFWGILGHGVIAVVEALESVAGSD